MSAARPGWPPKSGARNAMPRALFALALAAAAAAVAVASPASSTLPLNIEYAAVTGISSGGFAAVQYQVAFSGSLIGAGIVAGGPYYCARDSMENALTECMNFPEGIPLQTLVSAAEECAKSGKCDPLDGLKGHRAWIYSGERDSVVRHGTVVKLEQFYQGFMAAENITTVYNVDSEHLWPTQSYGVTCTSLGSPFIGRCDYDGSFEMMNFILGNASQPTTANSSAFYTISQATYAPNGETRGISLGPDAYAYVPAACAEGARCGLVIVFHGCQQTINNIGLTFVQHIGMNEVGEANRFVVVYPQAVPSDFAPSNPEGCFDWWGYTDSNYANKQGPQMATVNGLVNAVLTGSAVFTPTTL
jgi:poly(3-hydroxybutyrate) depolymerase